MRNVHKTRVLIWVLAVIPLILTAIFYSSLPDKIPMHWGLTGRVRYDPKIHIWWLSAISPAIAALFMVLPAIDPRKENIEKFRGFYDAFCLFMMAFMLGVVGIILSESFNPGKLRVEFLVTVGCGLLFVFLGNMIPKFKSNFFAGIRTPWTLSSNEVWQRTHRIAGFAWVSGGLLIIALSLILRNLALYIALLAIVAVITIFPIVMSYRWYQKLPENKK